MSFYLYSCNEEKVTVKFDVGAETVDGAVWGKEMFEGSNLSDEEPVKGDAQIFSLDRLTEDADKVLPNGRLTLLCNLEVSPNEDRQMEGTGMPKGRQAVAQPKNGLGSLLSQAFNNGDMFPDVTLNCGGQIFLCHKVVLGAWTDAFKAMFSNQMKENATSEVNIEDIEPDVLEQLLRFMYKDSINEETLAGMAAGLLAAADKYGVLKLKALCEEALCDNLNTGNAADLLVLSYFHRDVFETKILVHARKEFFAKMFLVYGNNLTIMEKRHRKKGRREFKRDCLKDFKLQQSLP